MSVRVEVSGDLLGWARERSGIQREDLQRRFAKLDAWEAGTASPTLKQLQDYANATHTPIGYFFLPSPPTVDLPLPDFRTRGIRELREPSPNLLDTIYQSQRRQDWYRDYARAADGEPLEIVGSIEPGSDVSRAAAAMSQKLGFAAAQRESGRAAAFRQLADAAEELGILVMVNGVVGSNTRRKLDPEEFQGFALVDDVAPVVFINGADTLGAQIFTLTHELVHIWSGQSALDDPMPADQDAADVESDELWCNAVAAEFLVPLAELRAAVGTANPLQQLDRLAGVFRASTLVVLRRLRDAGYVAPEDFWDLYWAELRRVRELASAGGGDGGNFYNTQPVRTSKKFARAVITSTLEGQTLYKDALRMLGFKKISTFNTMASTLGVI